jgi:hypothetical protein
MLLKIWYSVNFDDATANEICDFYFKLQFPATPDPFEMKLCGWINRKLINVPQFSRFALLAYILPLLTFIFYPLH